MALFLFTRKILAGEPIDVFNHGRHKRDFTYIDDIVEGVVRTLDRVAAPDPSWDSSHPDPASSSAPYRVYNIGNNNPVDLERYIRVLEDCLGRKAAKNLLPLQAGDVPDTFADVLRSRRRRRLQAGDERRGGRRPLRRLVPRLPPSLTSPSPRRGRRREGSMLVAWTIDGRYR